MKTFSCMLAALVAFVGDVQVAKWLIAGLVTYLGYLQRGSLKRGGERLVAGYRRRTSVKQDADPPIEVAVQLGQDTEALPGQPHMDKGDQCPLILLKMMHVDVIHAMRDLRLAADRFRAGRSSGGVVHKSLTAHAHSVCVACNGVMARILELEATQLHCSLKLLLPDGDAVETWARSTIESEGRKTSRDGAFLISKNTVWCALMGEDDTMVDWTRWIGRMPCFACNDLTLHRSLYQNSRNDWETLYKAVFVFPLRYENTDTDSYHTIGFLAFDSLQVNAFRGAPDVYDFRERADNGRYEHILTTEISAFHAGAIMADTLSMFLRGSMLMGDNHGG